MTGFVSVCGLGHGKASSVYFVKLLDGGRGVGGRAIVNRMVQNRIDGCSEHMIVGTTSVNPTLN